MPQTTSRNRANGEIRAQTVRLVDEEGCSLGVVPLTEALAAAGERDLDLVEVSPNASPPVCKILDLGRFRYQQSKRSRQAIHHRPKMVKFHLRISDHDRALKLDHVRQFLDQGLQVQLIVDLKGRERANPERAVEFIDGLLAELEHRTDQRSSAGARATALLTPQHRAA